jgi:hypothetical protein
MKILHLDSGREMRGGQWQVLRLHQALLEAGHESFLLSRAGSRLLAIAVRRGLPCEPLTPRFRSRNYDLVHAHDSRTHTLAALFARVPVVVSRRVAFPVHRSPASRWKYGKASRYLAVSRYVAGILAKAGIGRDRIDVVYDGVEIPNEPAQGDAIITPYTNDPAKGMALAKEAAMLAELPLVCSQDLERDLPNARVMIYITQSEGLGSGILLAMACGVTVIASNTGGIPELIEDGVTGFLVQNEARAIAEAISCVKPEVGCAARERAASNFTVAHMFQATLKSYAKALHV